MSSSDIIRVIAGFLLITSILVYCFAPVVNVLDECEKRGWDGSEYNTGVREIKLFQENEDIIVKCNKDKSGETDAMVGIKDAILGKG